MSFLDKAISAISPRLGVGREVDRVRMRLIQDSGYSQGGASRGKQWSKGYNAQSGDARDDITGNLSTLRQRCRDLFMNAPLGRAAISRVQINAVGTGLVLRPHPDTDFLGLTEEEADAWRAHVAREWSLWAGTTACDAAGLNTFAELQQVALLSWLQNGEVYSILPYIDRPGEVYPMKVRLLEADRVCDPNSSAFDVAASMNEYMDRGIELGPDGEIKAYHVAKRHPGSLRAAGANKWERIVPVGESGRRNILHLVTHERAEQYHGVPYLAPVIEMLKQLDRYSEAELMAAVVAGLFTVFVKTETPDNPLGEAVELTEQVDSENPNTYEMRPGGIVGLGVNESIDTANPGRPNTAFEGFVTALLREIGAALNQPYEVLLGSYNSSYSASRAALLQAFAFYRMWKKWMEDDFTSPIYREWLTDAILMGRIKAPGYFDDPVIAAAWQRANWHAPSAGQVDPVKEVKAAQERVKEGFSTRERETAELTGMDFRSNVRQRIREERLMSQLPAAPTTKEVIPDAGTITE